MKNGDAEKKWGRKWGRWFKCNLVISPQFEKISGTSIPINEGGRKEEKGT